MSLSGLKRLLVGKSLPTSAHAEERLSNGAALAVLSSDALSSVAYATEEILLVLLAAGSTALSYSMPIAAFLDYATFWREMAFYLDSYQFWAID